MRTWRASGASFQWNKIPETHFVRPGHTCSMNQAETRIASMLPENLDWVSDPPVMPDEDGRYDHLVPFPGIYKPF